MADEWANPRLQKRVADNVCAACRRPIEAGHRITFAFICIDPNARNPNLITERGLELGSNYEFAHVNCDNPFLDGKKIIV